MAQWKRELIDLIGDPDSVSRTNPILLTAACNSIAGGPYAPGLCQHQCMCHHHHYLCPRHT